VRKKFFNNEGHETPDQVTQRGGRCPIPGHIQGQVGPASQLKMALLIAEGLD